MSVMEDSLLDMVMEQALSGATDFDDPSNYQDASDAHEQAFGLDDDEEGDDMGDEYDDGDYPGVEMDENMSRIEGDDFWSGAEDIDSFGGDY